MAKETEIERLIVRLVGDSKQYQRMLQDSKEATRSGMTDITRSTQKMESSVLRSLKNIGRGMQRFGQGIGRIGRTASLAITAPIAGIGALAIRESMQYETALSRIVGLVGLSRETVAGFSEEIKGMAGEVGKGPTELANAMFFITSAGLRGESALEALRVSAMAASSGLGDTVAVADAVTSAMNAYGHENLSATRATEILTAAVRSGKAEASTFGPVLGQLLPTANELGISFDEIGGGLAFLTKATGSASLAATGLGGVMTQLIKPTEAAKKVFPFLTTAWVKGQIASKGFHQTLLDLRATVEGGGMEISKVFSDKEGMNAMLQLTGTSAKDAAQIFKDSANSIGIIGEAFEANAETMAFTWAKASADFKVALLEIGEIAAPIMSKLTGWLKIGTEWWKKLNKESKVMIVTVAAVAAAVGPLLVGLGTFVAIMGTAIVSIAGIAAGVIAFVNPTTLAIAAVVGLGTAILYWTGAGGQALDWFGKQWASLTDYIKPVIDGIKNAMTAGDLQLAFNIGWTQIQLAWGTGIQKMRESWQVFADTVRRIWSEVANDVSNYWEDTVSAISFFMAASMEWSGLVEEGTMKALVAEDKLEKKQRAQKNKSRLADLDDTAAKEIARLEKHAKELARLQKKQDGMISQAAKEAQKAIKEEGLTIPMMPEVTKLPPEILNPPVITVPIKFEVVSATLAGSAQALSEWQEYRSTMKPVAGEKAVGREGPFSGQPIPRGAEIPWPTASQFDSPTGENDRDEAVGLLERIADAAEANINLELEVAELFD